MYNRRGVPIAFPNESELLWWSLLIGKEVEEKKTIYLMNKYLPGITVCPNMIKDSVLGRETVSGVTS